MAAENRLVSITGSSLTASFVYDGDGRRVKSTVNGTTTYFIGAHYEVTGSTVTKYYFAGTQRIAMRKYTIPQSMTLEYFIGDHLGSTSVTTDKDGAKVSEMRYKPWGEVRSWWTSQLATTPAYKLPEYTFTGQFSYMDDPSTTSVTEGFGLMFYNARWYDPSLGRFAQADTIIPPGVQGLDRYAYTNNSPMNYVDPSGHNSQSCNADNFVGGKCLNKTEYLKYTLEETYSIDISGNWDLKKLKTLEESLIYAAKTVGGTDVLTGYFQSQMKNEDEKFTFLLTSDANRQKFCGNNDSPCQPPGMIVLSERHFDGRFNAEQKPPWGSDAHMKSLKTLLHEMGHVIISGNPEFIDNYKDDPKLDDLYFTNGSDPKESLANAFAFYAIGHGTGNSFPIDQQYALQMDYVYTTWYPEPSNMR